MLQRWFHQGTNGVPKFSLKKEGRLVLRRPSEEPNGRTCTIRPTWLAVTEAGLERRFEWQGTLEFDGVKTPVSEIAEVILALSGAGGTSDKRTASSCWLELDNVGCNFGKMRGLREISCLAAGCQMVAVMGPSGCGKSTLLGTLIGSVPLTAGGRKNHRGGLSHLGTPKTPPLGFRPPGPIPFSPISPNPKPPV